MVDQENLKRHAALMDQMAQTVGVDLEDAVLSGRLAIDEISDAVLRCTKCASPDTCPAWMAGQSEPADRAPDYCGNRSMLQRLQSVADR